MELQDIMAHCAHLAVSEKRCTTNEFVELVFHQADLEEWQRILSALLGPPIKPKGQAPSENDLKITAKTGGIRIDQTLFEKEFEDGTVIAKFWPWRDIQHITLRMALLLKG